MDEGVGRGPFSLEETEARWDQRHTQRIPSKWQGHQGLPARGCPQKTLEVLSDPFNYILLTALRWVSMGNTIGEWFEILSYFTCASTLLNTPLLPNANQNAIKWCFFLRGSGLMCTVKVL